MKLTEIQHLLDDKYLKISSLRELIRSLIEDESQIDDLQNKNDFIEKLKDRERELRRVYRQKQAVFVSLANGRIGIGGRPSVAKIQEFKDEGVTCIVTLLKPEEKLVEELGSAIQSAGIEWVWFPLSASQLPDDEDFKNNIKAVYEQLISILKNGGTVFIHCAAGVHRTGSFTNGLLRKMGLSKEESKSKIFEMRPITAIEAVTKHWNWSEKIIN